jgi:hypothetical protein
MYLNSYSSGVVNFQFFHHFHIYPNIKFQRIWPKLGNLVKFGSTFPTLNRFQPLSSLFMKKNFTIFIMLVVVSAFFVDHAHAQDWVLKKNKGGVKVYVRDQAGTNIKELKFSTTIEASLTTIAAVLTDVKGYDEWSYGASNSRVVKRISDTEVHYYTEVDFPWPFDNRDVILHSKFWQDKKTLALHSYSSSSHWMEKESDGIIRIKKCEISWVFTPIGNGKVQVDYFLNSDPAGNIPAWMINLAADQGPLNTMALFKEMLKKEKYRNSKLAYVQEKKN